ncbi:hypothetical protein [Odoribacter sp. Z80]|uniref:hypothetical protein n=1 Tax=Odoribacter sp. Z80 TaxID=2304575 RepID=UPI00137AA580|nr:hypothetical protein [Odoribacter sp. Z80]NCE72384.1 hypothetical protein [Odoribacter sp. Z80]
MSTISLEERREQASQLVEEIRSIKDSLTSILHETDTLFKNIKSNDKGYKALIEKLNDINERTRIAITAFKKDQSQITRYFKEADKFYQDKYLPLTEKYAITKKEFTTNANNAEKDAKKFKELKAECTSKYEEIIVLGKNYKAKITELKKIEAAIQKLHKASEQNKGKIDDLYRVITEVHKDILLKCENIKELHSECDNLTKDIQKYRQESDSNNQKIHKLHETSKVTLSEIQKIYEIASETGLSGEFEKRRDTLKKEIDKWGKYIFLTSILLFGGILALFVFQLGLNCWKLDDTFDLNFYIRFLIFSPVVYYLYFISVQYSQAKELHDKYAFKTTLSMTIKSHIELLTQQGYFNEKEHVDKVLKFILDGFRNIYSEPNKNSENYKMKVKLANIEIELQKKIIAQLSKSQSIKTH